LALALVGFNADEKHVEDDTANGVYDRFETIYLSVDSTVNVGDIRLVNADKQGSFFDGSIVKSGDADEVLGASLIGFNADEKHEDTGTDPGDYNSDQRNREIIVTLSFVEDSEFFSAADVSTSYHTRATAPGSGIGGSLTELPDKITVFTSQECPVGKDPDGDSVCNGWEKFGIGANTILGGGTIKSRIPVDLGVGEVGDPGDIAPVNYDDLLGKGRLPLNDPGPDKKHKDIFVEIDYMQGHKPSQQALEDVIDMFANSGVPNDVGGTGIDLHIDVDDALPFHTEELAVWSDDDLIHTNDFNSIKARWFGADNERTRTTDGSFMITAGPSDSYTLTLSGFDVTTPQRTNPTTLTDENTIANLQIRFIADFGAFVDVNFGTPVYSGTDADITIDKTKLKGIIDLGDITNQILNIKIKFGTDGKVTSAPIGTVTIPFTLTDPLTDLPLSTTLSLTKEGGTPRIVSQLIAAKAQVWHYFIWSHSLGDSVNCGPSGAAEIRGNDGILALGCNWNPLFLETGFTETDPGQIATVGSDIEQSGTFAHELGHNLGLHHGGVEIFPDGTGNNDATINCKPDYVSVMSYSRQLDNYLLGAWDLDYSKGFVDSITEASLVESAGLGTSSGTPTIVYGSPGGTTAFNTVTLPAASIDWSNDGDAIDVDSAPFDVNDMGFNGCEGFGGTALDVPTYGDEDDWNNLEFNFRGPQGASFDAKESHYNFIIGDEQTPILQELIESTFDQTDTERPTADGSEETDASGHFEMRLTLTSCAPDFDFIAQTGFADPSCDVVALKQSGDYFVEGQTIKVTVKKLNGAGTDAVAPATPPIPSHDGLFPVDGTFVETAPGQYKTELNLDQIRENAGSEATAAGLYALIFTLDKGTSEIILQNFDFKYQMCQSTPVIDDACTDPNVINNFKNDPYSARLTLVEVP